MRCILNRKYYVNINIHPHCNVATFESWWRAKNLAWFLWKSYSNQITPFWDML